MLLEEFNLAKTEDSDNRMLINAEKLDQQLMLTNLEIKKQYINEKTTTINDCNQQLEKKRKEL